MAAARLLPVSGKTQQQAAKLSKVSQQRISEASVVIEFAPDLVAGVMAGSPGLDAAYEIATRRHQDAMAAARMCPETGRSIRQVAARVRTVSDQLNGRPRRRRSVSEQTQHQAGDAGAVSF